MKFPPDYQNKMEPNSSVTVIVFNRPSKTKLVLDRIKKAKPKRVFIIADGPRNNHPLDLENCKKVRKLCDEFQIDGEVSRNYTDNNLGCGVRPATGISWVLGQVDRTIILEDDCLPHPSFFQFCDGLLEKYKDEPQIGMIAGTNLGIRDTSNNSYYLSKYAQIWGWATWRRAWSQFDISTPDWESVRESNWLHEWLESIELANHYKNAFDRHFYRKDVWDYMWLYAMWRQSSYCIVPNQNLISNIGFDPSATHTGNKDYFFANAKTKSMNFPLEHPKVSKPDPQTELKLFKTMTTRHTSLLAKLKRRLKTFVN